MSFRNNSETRSAFKLWIVVCGDNSETKDTGWLSRQDFKKLQSSNVFLSSKSAFVSLQICFYFSFLCLTISSTTRNISVISLGSTTNTVRQLEGRVPYFLTYLLTGWYSWYNSSCLLFLRTSCCMHLSHTYLQQLNLCQTWSHIYNVQFSHLKGRRRPFQLRSTSRLLYHLLRGLSSWTVTTHYNSPLFIVSCATKKVFTWCKGRQEPARVVPLWVWSLH